MARVTVTSAPGPAVRASPEPAGGAGELVGWVQPARGRMTRAGARDALATALGVASTELATLSPGTVSQALDRLRAIAIDRLRLAAAAERDELTGASRRGAGLELLAREVSRSRRLGQPLTVAFLDVDGLKAVNDELGHPAGDRLLQDVVGALHERLRGYDVVTRYGGDEFVVVLPGTGQAVAERLLSGINAQIRQRTGGRGVSIGVAELAEGESATEVLARADQLLVGRRRRRRSRDSR
ncbi:MAG: GGDEF domain-containing protein [Candidatus Dormibacteria bacterium]